MVANCVVGPAGIEVAKLLGAISPAGGSLSSVSILTLGLVFGLKHAFEADHLAAVSAIVSERKSLLSSSGVGGLWGIGHTVALLIAGAIVLLVNIQISRGMELVLECFVAIMLVGLGANASCKRAEMTRCDGSSVVEEYTFIATATEATRTCMCTMAHLRAIPPRAMVSALMLGRCWWE